jgi:hypothetical protein
VLAGQARYEAGRPPGKTGHQVLTKSAGRMPCPPAAKHASAPGDPYSWAGPFRPLQRRLALSLFSGRPVCKIESAATSVLRFERPPKRDQNLKVTFTLGPLKRRVCTS